MITRHFIDITSGSNKRRVHYRRAGNGPPLLMVHQSPRSSAEYEELMLKWSEHFTCIAPDTPGFGHSDPLPGHPEIGAFGDATIELLDALGIEKCAAYGFHSGGIILVTAVKRHPRRITTLAVGGYAIWTPEEMDLFSDKYLPEFHPSIYGEHLTWLWNRILEQSWFFPWFASDDEHRLSVAHDDPQRVHAVIMDMLNSGNAYQAGYGAVLRAPRDIPAVDTDVPPCLITAYNGDPLQEHIDRLGQMPANWSARKVASPADHQEASLAHLLGTPTPSLNNLPEASDEGFVHITAGAFDGLIHWRGNRDAKTLCLHAPARAIATDVSADAIHIDLPGHGLSDSWEGEIPTSWDAWEQVLQECASHFGAETLLFGEVPEGDPDRLYPDLSPDRFGQYLTKAWQIVRAAQIFSPWYKANAKNAIAFDPDALAPKSLAALHLDLINARAAKQYHLALQAR